MRLSIISGILLLFLVSPVFALTFSSVPTVTFDGDNVTTTGSFTCVFTPSGTGALTANITWFRNSTQYTGVDQSVAVSSGVSFESTAVPSAATTKSDVWRCQVTLDNTSQITTQNSSTITIFNTKPEINPPAQLIYYEDTPVSFTFTASDPDNDAFTWTSLDTDRAFYGNNELFIIGSDGSVTISQTNEDLVGNHTMQISAFDEPAAGSTVLFEFELRANNDAPIFTQSTLNYSCTERQECAGQIQAVDEDNASGQLTYTFNTSFINGSSDGSFTFFPTFAQALAENYTIQVNVTDGNSTVSEVIDLTLQTVNQEPNVTFFNVSGTQNDASFFFEINATDTLDLDDAFNFSITSTCGFSPWIIENVTNGTGGNVATGRVNTSLASNDYVACRDVQITIFEIDTGSGNPRDSYQYNITFNITNVNDQPFIAEVNADETQSNMSALTAALGLSFNYTVNASDPDDLTYEGEEFNFTLHGSPTFANGSDLFLIDAVSGEVYSALSEMNASYVGNFSFIVNVTDDQGLFFERNLSVQVSFNEQPQIDPFNTSMCFDNFTCIKNISATDTEGSELTLSLNSLSILQPDNTTVNYTNQSAIASLLGLNLSNFTFVDNRTTFLLNFTPDDQNRGNYTLNFTFADNVGTTNTTVVEFFVNNTPEAPGFDDDLNHDILNPWTFPNFYETIPYFKYFYLADDDLTFNNDSLTFNYTLNATPAGLVFSQINNTHVLLNYTPDEFQSGVYAANFTVTDAYNLTTLQSLSFTIFDTSAFPNITAVQPFYNSSSSATQTSLAAITETDNLTSVNFFENDTVIFNFTAVDGDNLNMHVLWYENNSLVQNTTYGAHAYTRTFNFTEEGNYNITAIVSDIGSDAFTWNVSVNNTNRPPRLVNFARNLTGANAVQGSSAILFSQFFFLSFDSFIVFYDPDDDPNDDGEIVYTENETNSLTFEVDTSGTCDELATFTFNGVDDNVSITPGASGTCETRFIATDPEGENVSSNLVTIQIIQTQSSASSTSSSTTRTRTITETVTVPIEDPVDVPEEVDIIFPGITTMYVNNTAVIPVTIRNNWDSTLTRINLGLNDTSGLLSYSFSQQFFASLPEDQEVYTNLTISGYRVDEPISFNVTAYIGSLQYEDYETVHINALERGSEDLNAIRSRISFARDLLTDNPECGELLEVLEGIEQDGASVNSEILNNVINGCKYLIGQGFNRTDAFPKSFSGRLSVYGKTVLDYDLLGTVVGGLVAVSLVVGLFVKLSMKKI